MPHKSDYRMRAHCNPLSEIPSCPSQVDWSIHYGLKIANDNELNYKLADNTKNYPIDFNKLSLNNKKVNLIVPESTNKDNNLSNSLNNIKVNILDIGCGYGGLLFNLTSILGDRDLALGLEIRDKVSNYVGERIKSIRINSKGNECSNISITKTNAMKVLLNYFYKGQIDKMFFCFADPHFKNTYLLQDYAYILKEGGILYSITDVEDLHNWHLDTLNSFPLFEQISNENLELDPYLKCMKDTDEARKVKRNNGSMYYSAWKRVSNKINSAYELINIVKNQKQDN